jgi:hypothetical protein
MKRSRPKEAHSSPANDVIIEVKDSQEDVLRPWQRPASSRDGTIIPDSQENTDVKGNTDATEASSSNATYQPSGENVQSSYIMDKSDLDAERIEFVRC